ncbi:MAG TPA: SDR family NAD(P)-dependent oxidoreductase [Gemmatimonadales bacterium]|nr:SDR family NAD(P)-dependent oxidoreductase [Gemmatimonadales bacterium]
MSSPFPGTTAFVTGASRGIGAALAAGLAARGARLVLSARRLGPLEAVAAPLMEQGAAIELLPADLTLRDAPARIVDELETRGIVVDHLVNNAGWSGHGRTWEVPPAVLAGVQQVNGTAPMELAARLLPGMLLRRRGGILNIGSTAAFQGMPWTPAYGASKAFLVSWSEALHVELHGTGVRCTAVCPGPVATPFFAANHFPGEPPRWMMVSAESVAEFALRAYERNRSVAVTGLLARLVAWATRLSPRALNARVAEGYARPGGLGRTPTGPPPPGVP